MEVENDLESDRTVVAREEGKVAAKVDAAPTRERAFLMKVANLERREIPWPLPLLAPSPWLPPPPRVANPW